MDQKKVFANFLWRFFERTGARLVSTVVSIILARLLEPSVYGSIALVTVFTTILQVFVDSGFANALIQKKDADDLDFSTVFYFNIAICFSLYVIMFVCAPFIARFYNDSSLTPVIRVLSLTLVISGVKNVQQAYVSRTMQFKRFFFSTLGGTIGAAVIGITMAYLGFGIWALVVQQIFNASVDTLILWLTVRWRPKKLFSFDRLKLLFSFGWKLLASTLLDTTYNNIRQLIIGKLYSSKDLAQYNRGDQFPALIITNINTSIDSVLFPSLSQSQDDISRVKAMTRRAMKTSTYVISPMMIGLVFVGKPLIRLLLTEKWLPCVPFLSIFCITYMFYPIHTANLNAIKAMGRSDVYLKLEIIKKILGFILLFSTMWFGVMAMAYSMLLDEVLCQMINSWPNKKLLNYGYLEQIKDILPSILLAAFMGVCIYPIQFFISSDFLTLFLQIIAGVCIYVLGSKLFHIDSFEFMMNILKSVLRKGKRDV